MHVQVTSDIYICLFDKCTNYNRKYEHLLFKQNMILVKIIKLINLPPEVDVDCSTEKLNQIGLSRKMLEEMKKNLRNELLSTFIDYTQLALLLLATSTFNIYNHHL
ncbi:hypothetical protein ACJX0J_015529, partial [Zea mays]